MTNHIHLIAVPDQGDGLQRMLKPLHMRYAQRVNRARGWKGHVWQGRFFSSPLDEAYCWAAIRYVERNPVRAKMVPKAEDYRWSSAAAHCGLRTDTVLSEKSECSLQDGPATDGSSWLAEADSPQNLAVLRRNVYKGLPCGTDKFIGKLERIAGGSCGIGLLGVLIEKGSVPFSPISEPPIDRLGRDTRVLFLAT